MFNFDNAWLDSKNGTSRTMAPSAFFAGNQVGARGLFLYTCKLLDAVRFHQVIARYSAYASSLDGSL